MIRHMGLYQAAPARLFTSGTSRHLMQQLECPLTGPWVRLTEPEITIYDPDRCKIRKMVPLRDELRADYNVSLTRFDRLDHLPHFSQPRYQVTRQDRNPRVRPALLHLLADALDARTAGHHFAWRLTFRAFVRHR